LLSPFFHPWWDGEKNWKKKAKLVGWDKGSLIEQQRKRKITAITLMKKIYKAGNTQCNFLTRWDSPPLADSPT